MIDKVEVRIPAAAQFTAEFSRVYRDVSGDSKIFRPSQHYIRVGDLRTIGYHSLLHVHCQRDTRGNHKLELIDVGDLSFPAIQREIQGVFDIDSWQLGIMRIDLACDVTGIPVLWFARNARAKFKQWVAQVGKIEFAEMGRRNVETVYFGKRPNCFRIYDKISELHHQYDQMLRKASDATEFPTFQEKYGYPPTGFVLTRVERQIGGGRVPEQINKVGKLRKLPEFNPFDRLEFLAGPSLEPNISDYGMKFFTGIGLRFKADEIGIHALRSLLNKVSSGNASRTLREYASFLSTDCGINEEALYRQYQKSVRRQLAA